MCVSNIYKKNLKQMCYLEKDNICFKNKTICNIKSFTCLKIPKKHITKAYFYIRSTFWEENLKVCFFSGTSTEVIS